MRIRARVGAIEILAVTDGEAPAVEPSWPFPDVPAEIWSRHACALDRRGHHRSNFGAFVVRSGAETVLVDTGIGPDPPARFASGTGTLPASLADLGIRVEEVTTVVLTHLHFDHVGWAVSPDASSPTFANARYLVDRADWTHWESSRHPDRAFHERAFRKRAFPLEELGVLQLIDGEVQVADGARTLPTPGHTPGHQSVLLESGGERGIVTGDVFHSVLQFAEPGWSHRADVDPDEARATRLSLLGQMTPDVILAAGHLMHGSNLGTVTLLEGRRQWRAPEAPDDASEGA